MMQASMALLDAHLIGDQDVRQHSYVESDHEIFSIVH